MNIRKKTEAWAAEAVIVPGTASFDRPFVAPRGNTLRAAKAAHGDFYAFCVRDADPAPADATLLDDAQLAAWFAGSSPREVLAMQVSA
jgi:hypothetical protein